METAFGNPEFDHCVSDREFGELERLSVPDRSSYFDRLQDRYTVHKKSMDEMSADPAFTKWVESIASPEECVVLAKGSIIEKSSALAELHVEYAAEQTAAAKIAEEKAAQEAQRNEREAKRRELAELKRKQAISAIDSVELEIVPEKEVKKVVEAVAPPSEQPSTRLPRLEIVRETDGENFSWKLGIKGKKPSTTAREATEAAKDLGEQASITAETIKEEVATGISKTNLATLLAAGATAIAIIKGVNTDIQTAEPGIAHTETDKHQDASPSTISLAPGHLNPAVEVPNASQIAEQKYQLAADEVIPKNLRRKLIAAGISSARIKVRTISANPSMHASEPNHSELNRGNPSVRAIDAIALYGIRRLHERGDLTPHQIDQGIEGAVKSMMAARFPHTVHSLAPDFKPENGFQSALSKDMKNTVFEQHGPYTKEQAAFIGNLIAKEYDDTTPESRRNSAHDDLKHEAKKYAGHHHEAHVTNPHYTLGEILAGVSGLESGKPSKPTIRNKYGYYGPWQESPHYWAAPGGWAETYLGDKNAPMSLENMVMATVKLWDHNMSSLGSAEAAMAEWLKGPAAGLAIAGKDPAVYRHYMRQADGNGTTIKRYINIIDNNIRNVDVHRQLPWLKKVMKDNPNFDWSLLNKEYPMYSQIHLDGIRQRTQKKELHKQRIIAGDDIARAAWREFHKNGNKVLETRGQNLGPQVQKYTNGLRGPWCAWFVSYVAKEAGYKFENGPAWNDGSIPRVSDLVNWFKQYGIHYTKNSKSLTPQPGDIIMYGHNEHTGIVVKVEGDIIETIEGNTSGNNRHTAEGDTVGHKRFNYKTYPTYLDFGRLRYPKK
jgi:hypothetical protein